MSDIQQISINKNQLLTNFLKIKHWLTEYWHFLENLPLDIFSDDEDVVEYLRIQHQNLVNTKVKLETFEMVGSVLSFSLERIKREQLTFRMPSLPEPPSEYQNVEKLFKEAHELEPALQNVVEKVTYLSRHLPQSEEKFIPLLQTIGSLFKAIIRQDGDDMSVQLSHINLLTSTKESNLLIQEVGKITREIYNSLQGISADLDTEEIHHITDEMPDAVQKLNSVIDRLEEAANDNLEFLEELIQQSEHNVALVEDLAKTFEKVDERLDEFVTNHPDLKDEILPMKEIIEKEMHDKIEVLLKTFHENENLFLTIMTNQGFQDLTGQTLKKIVNFLEHLELRLLELIQKFSDEYGTKPPSAEKEDFLTRVDHGSEGEDIQLHGPDETESKKSTQNDVDALLAEMGF